MPPTPPSTAGASTCDLDRITTDVIAKITASTGNAHRSNAWTRLCPKNASPVWITTMSTSASSGPMWNSVDSANAPLTLLVANHPTPAVIDISSGRHHVALEPERQPAQHHLRNTVQRPTRGQEVVRERAESGADDDAGDGLPERHAVIRDREHTDEDRRELEVGRRPRPEQLTRLSVPVRLGDVFVSAGFNRGDAVAVAAFGAGFSRCHATTVDPGTRSRNRNRRSQPRRCLPPPDSDSSASGAAGVRGINRVAMSPRTRKPAAR